MRFKWGKVAGKFFKHGVITALGGAAAAIQAVPPGQQIDSKVVLSAAIIAMITGGGLGAGQNVFKHREKM